MSFKYTITYIRDSSRHFYYSEALPAQSRPKKKQSVNKKRESVLRVKNKMIIAQTKVNMFLMLFS